MKSLLAHRPAIIWLTGLSGAGKSTLAAAVSRRLRHEGILTTCVDGDALRAGLNAGLGFSPEDRKENIRRAGEVALLFAETGVVVLAALISPYREDRKWIAERASQKEIPFAEVYVNASLESCERRDPKNLYKRARSGRIPNFTGIDSPYEAPTAPALEIQTDLETLSESAEKLFQLSLSLARPDLIARRTSVRRMLLSFWNVWTPSLLPKLSAAMYPLDNISSPANGAVHPR
jgi:adenylyl-sulfate kinase